LDEIGEVQAGDFGGVSGGGDVPDCCEDGVDDWGVGDGRSEDEEEGEGGTIREDDSSSSRVELSIEQEHRRGRQFKPGNGVDGSIGVDTTRSRDRDRGSSVGHRSGSDVVDAGSNVRNKLGGGSRDVVEGEGGSSGVGSSSKTGYLVVSRGRSCDGQQGVEGGGESEGSGEEHCDGRAALK